MRKSGYPALAIVVNGRRGASGVWFYSRECGQKGKALVSFCKQHDKPVPNFMHCAVFPEPMKIGNTSVYV
jgi:hypothetical protein